jgi:urease accessory protein
MMLGLVAVAQPAAAHSLGAGGTGLGAGLAHPLLGLDHLLALLGAGLWASWLGGRLRWALPAAFLGALFLGALLAWQGLVLPAVEPMIAASVLVFGLLGASAVRSGGLLGLIVTLGFGLFHGQAHGMELPLAAGATGYAIGLLLSSAAVLGLGLVSGQWLLGGGAQRLHRGLAALLGGIGAGWLIAG